MRAGLRRGLLIALALVGLAGGLAWAFWPQPVAVDLATIGRGPLQVTVDGEGMTRVREVYTVSAPLAGRVMRTPLKVGDPVVAHQTVLTSLEETDPAFLDQRTRARLEAEIQAADAGFSLGRAELERARAELDFARNELRRAEALYPRGALTERALDQARLDVRTHEARVATAEATLRMRRFELESARAAMIEPGEDGRFEGLASRCCIAIRAPVDGQVLRVIRESETVVQPGDPLIEIGDPRDLEIVVDLPSQEAVRVREGAAVIVDAWGGEVPLAGRVRRIEPYGFTKISALGIEEQRVNVVIEIEDPPEARPMLGHGYRVVARIVVHAADDVLLVPAGALFREGGDWAVFVMDDDRARLRRVRLGPGDGRVAELQDGLAEGDRVVLHPSDRVAEGVRIAPRS
jgi:HlyD family secretion protein